MRFDSYHPIINLIYFVSVIAAAIAFWHPVFIGIGFVCAFLYSVRLCGRRAFVFDLVLIPCAVLFGLWFATFMHFGTTVLFYNRLGNAITTESIACGIATGFKVATVLVWFSCVHAVFSADKVVYLFGRISPRLSLFLAILLRLVPRLKTQARVINNAQKGIGRGMNEHHPLRKIRNGIRIFSILLTWFIESLITTSDSMRSRGYTLKGRTAYSLYRFDNRDRGFVVAIFFCLTVVLMAVLFHQTATVYHPTLVINPVTPLSYAFYAGYALLCLLPLLLETACARSSPL